MRHAAIRTAPRVLRRALGSRALGFTRPMLHSSVRSGTRALRYIRGMRPSSEPSAVSDLAEMQRTMRAMLELTQALASSLDMSDILFTVVKRIAESMNVERVSVVLAPAGETGSGYVVAASDDQGITNLRIDLEKYPEIAFVLRTRAPLTIADSATHPVLDDVRSDMPAKNRGPVSLIPITWQDETMGVLFLRKSVERGQLSKDELEFCQTAANATAIALRNARVMQTLRDQTQQVNFARFEAERRMRNLKRYANLFTSAADGLVAIDADGKLLFANPRAYEIAGVEETNPPATLVQLLLPVDRLKMIRLWKQVRRGVFPLGVDVRLADRTLACSFSPLKETNGAVLIIRDVTTERSTARELVRVKEFLESVIRASVDAIIAANVQGEVLVFNPGAERITGWKASEMIGKRMVKALYPGDGALEVMRMIRSEQHGGVGRLEAVRWDVQDRNGHLVPVQLSAAMIYDADGRPFGTVGIFTDLREKMRIEMRLSEAQEKLALSEKQTILAELAGTAAHELNQPLTSIAAYAELLQKKAAMAGLPPEDPFQRAAAVISSEAHRMADIVRKIGQMTRYETKSYVGSQKILDLERAATEQSADEPSGAEKR